MLEKAEELNQLYDAYFDFSPSERIKLMERLVNFKSLKEGWDGYGALPMADGAYNNMKHLISALSAETLSRWRLFPGKNGSLTLSTKDNKAAGISIGNTTMSYGLITDKGDNVTWQGRFSLDAAIEAFRKIHELLGYEKP